MKALFLKINTFRATFVLNFSNFTCVDYFCDEDQFFQNVNNRFDIQGQQLSRPGPHLQAFLWLVMLIDTPINLRSFKQYHCGDW